MQFTVLPARVEIEALEDIHLPVGMETNIFRGAFGMALRKVSCRPECAGVLECVTGRQCTYARVFEPVWEGGPSGYQDPPRPFVLRVARQKRRIHAGEGIRVDLFLFDTRLAEKGDHWVELARAFEVMGAAGLGSSRGTARLRVFERGGLDETRAAETLTLPVRSAEGTGRIRVEFVTPTELKHKGEIQEEPDFGAVAHRLAERVWALGRLYQGWPRDWDYRDLLDLSPMVRRVAWHWDRTDPMRRSSRTHEVHSIGGFTGWAEYEGPVGAFRALLEIGRWTGVGRQTVWGKGEIRIVG